MAPTIAVAKVALGQFDFGEHFIHLNLAAHFWF
jgi:hypothetical protein